MKMDKIFSDAKKELNNLEIPDEWIKQYGGMEKWNPEYLKEYMRLRYYVVEHNKGTPLQQKKFNYMKRKKPPQYNNYCKNDWKGPKILGLKINKGLWKIDFRE